MSKLLELSVEIQRWRDTMNEQQRQLGQLSREILEVSLERNQLRQDLQAATLNFERLENENNAAETVLDGYAAALALEETAFDSLADYITTVMDAALAVIEASNAELAKRKANDEAMGHG